MQTYRVQVIVLRLPSTGPPYTSAVSDGIAAAEQALSNGELATAEELGRAALRERGSLAARLILAQALAWQGRGRDADAVLAEVDPTTLTDTELMSWALPRAANQSGPPRF